jgi:transcriptional regulator with XRE-family HTH domain
MPKRVTERTEYGQRLLTARTKAALTQVQLAKAAGISQGTLAELEKIGQGSAFTPMLARACQVSAEWLASGEGPMVGGAEGLSPEVAELAQIVNGLPKAQREWVLQMCRHAVEIVTKEPPSNAGEPTDEYQRHVRMS